MRTTAAFLDLELAKLGITGCKREDRAMCQGAKGAILGLMRLNCLSVRLLVEGVIKTILRMDNFVHITLRDQNTDKSYQEQ